MKYRTYLIAALVAFTGTQAEAQTNKITSIAIGTVVTSGGTAQGVATVTGRTPTSGLNPGGLTYTNTNVPLDSGPTSRAFFTLSGANVPTGGTVASAFSGYGTLTGLVSTHADVTAKLTPSSYSGLVLVEGTFSLPTSGCFYTIHHGFAPGGIATDYFSVIVPGTGSGSNAYDLKPMSWQAAGGASGGPASAGVAGRLTGYFGLAYSAADPVGATPYAAKSMYYLRTDTSDHTQFGIMIPALESPSTDITDLTTAKGSFGVGGYAALAFTDVNVGFGSNQFYYLRQDTGAGRTGNTILGRLNPVAGQRTISDIANLGGVFSTLTFGVDATGPVGVWGTNQFFVTGTMGTDAQSISFEAIPDHNVNDVFTITPTASSTLDLVVTVVSGPATVTTTGVVGNIPSLRIFTVTTTGPGVVKLRATQAGSTTPIAYAANFMEQSFNVAGLPSVTSSGTAAGTVGAAFTYNITATGDPILAYTATGLPGTLTLNTTTGVITGTPTVAGVINATVTARNSTGTSSGFPFAITVAPAAVAPIITSAISAPGTVGTTFVTYQILATGLPTSYSVTGLPAGLTLNTLTGTINGTPTAPGISVATINAINSTGTGTASLTITVAPAGVAPIITSARSAPATVGVAFSYTISATESPSQFYGASMPPWLTVNTSTGALTGTPTAAGVSIVIISAGNYAGNDVTTLTITVAPAAVAPIITSAISAPGTVGTPFVTYRITATGLPTSYSAVGLPPGLSINVLTGAIDGTPLFAGSSLVSLGASNSSGVGNATLTIIVAPAAVVPVMTSALSALGTVGRSFPTYLIAATGLPTSYSATGLPAGLSVNSLTGRIDGVPTSVGTTIATISAANTTGTGTATLSITIAELGVVPAISSSATAPATVGVPFATYFITASGQPTNYAAAGLPSGLTINNLTGAINGTPVGPGVYVVTLNANNPAGTGSATLTITVATSLGLPLITSATTAPGTVGVPFATYLIEASGLPTRYAAAGLPLGLTINNSTGAINGTPIGAGVSVVTLNATNSFGTGSSTLTITVASSNDLPTITSAGSAAGTLGIPFTTYFVTATGLPTRYAASGLPPGLKIDNISGAINGSPTGSGISVVTLNATNSTGTGSATLTITVAPAAALPIITSATVAPGTAGATFATYFITATGLPTSFAATGLPAGLVINPVTGAINGIPVGPGIFIATLNATNASGTGSATLTVTVAPNALIPIITSALNVSGAVGVPFGTYSIEATGLPTRYAAAGLPSGLTINPLSGSINGTPTLAGRFIATLNATNATGTGSSTLTITVAPAAVAPIITSPVTAPGTVGTVFVTYPILATGLPTSYAATGLPAGLTLNPLTGAINGTPTTAGIFVVTLTATNSIGADSATLTITVAPTAVVPIITSLGQAAATVGTPFVTYLITATGLPTSFTAKDLPAGLTLNTLTGAINGTPTTAGVSLVTLNATNATGTGSATLTVTTAAAAVAPIITSSGSAVGTVGRSFVTYQIVATGLPTSFTATGLPAGLTLNALTGAINGTPTAAGVSVATVRAINATGTGNLTLTITVAAAPVAPTITSPPSAAGTVGSTFATYVVTAAGLPTSFSATGLPAGLTLNPLTGAITGIPTKAGTSFVTLQATNTTGTGSGAVIITVVAVPSSRIVNFSARALSGPGSQTLIMGFVVNGDGKNLLVRGIGPGLAPYGVTNFLADPMLTLYGATGAFASNDDWQTTAAGQASGAVIAALAQRVGAFALPNGSKDSSLLFTVNNGAHTTGLLRPNSTTGVALTEIYDTDVELGARLINVSARMNISAGEGTLIAGVIIAGNAPKTLLVRGVGPGLAAYGVEGVLADPTISLYSGSTLLASNNDWGTGGSTPAQLADAAVRVGAFPLTAGSRDAVLLVTLQPGVYSVQVSGAGGSNGVALVEIYDTE